MLVWGFWLRPKGRYIQDSWVQRSRGEKKNWQKKLGTLPTRNRDAIGDVAGVNKD